MKRWLWALGAAAGMALAQAASAQTTQDAVEPQRANTGAFTLTGGVDWTTSYFFRGYNQEDTGLIFQPYATLGANVYDGEKVDVNAYIGTWNSFHEKQTVSAGTGPSAWYESRIFGGLDVSWGKFTFGAVYTFYQFPNGAFETIQELGLKVSYDDTDLMKKAGIDFGLKPYVAVYMETDDGNGTEDTYLEVGIAPSIALGKSGVILSVPIALGMSLDDYYLNSDGSNAFFGFGSIGVMASMPLPIPSKYGTWTLTGGVQYIYLFADSAQLVNDGGTEDEWLGKIGVSFSY